MSQISLDEFKQHARIDDYAGDSEDAKLQQCLDAAESYAFRYIHRTYDELVEEGGGTLPDDVKEAILSLASSFYEQRESDSNVQRRPVPFGFFTIMASYRKLSNTTNGSE